MALVEIPFSHIIENGVEVGTFYMTYDDNNGTADSDTGSIQSARGVNNSTDLVFMIHLLRYSSGAKFDATLNPGQSASWNVPNAWKPTTLSDISVSQQTTYPLPAVRGSTAGRKTKQVALVVGKREKPVRVELPTTVRTSTLTLTASGVSVAIDR